MNRTATHHDEILEWPEQETVAVRCDLAEIWEEAVRIADADLALYKQSTRPTLRKQCPLLIDEILDRNFDFLASVAAIRKRLQMDRPKT